MVARYAYKHAVGTWSVAEGDPSHVTPMQAKAPAAAAEAGPREGESERGVDAGRGAAEDGAGEGQEGDGEEGGSGRDPYEGMSARERKLAELRKKAQLSRKANQKAVVDEHRRNAVREEAHWAC